MINRSQVQVNENVYGEKKFQIICIITEKNGRQERVPMTSEIENLDEAIDNYNWAIESAKQDEAKGVIIALIQKGGQLGMHGMVDKISHDTNI